MPDVPPQFVAIVGGSGSGKTWLADRLASQLGRRAGRLSLDDFYQDRSHLTLAQRKRINFDHPRAIDWTRFLKTLRELKRGRYAHIPIYDFTRSTRSDRSQECRPHPVMLIDGLWLLRQPQSRRLMDFSIYLRCPARLRLERRLNRDAAERARTGAFVRHQFRTHTEPMHRRFVEPQSRRAQVVLSSPLSDADVISLGDRISQALIAAE